MQDNHVHLYAPDTIRKCISDISSPVKYELLMLKCDVPLQSGSFYFQLYQEMQQNLTKLNKEVGVKNATTKRSEKNNKNPLNVTKIKCNFSCYFFRKAVCCNKCFLICLAFVKFYLNKILTRLACNPLFSYFFVSVVYVLLLYLVP